MSNWKKYRSHFLYTMEHKWYVFVECCKFGIPWRGLVHDLSKFRPREFIPYALFFFDEDGNKKANSPDSKYTAASNHDFQIAWFEHQKINKHHWHYWTLPKEDGKGGRELHAVEMPLKYVWEMISDWHGAGRAKGTGDALSWYKANRDNMVLHDITRHEIELILGYNHELH